MADEPIKVNFKGDKELEADLRRMASSGGALQTAVATVAERICQDTARQVRFPIGRQLMRSRGDQSRAPGTLQRSVSVRRQPFGATLAVGAIYAGAVEFGGWPRGRPFLRGGRYLWPVWSARLAGMTNDYNQEVQEMIDGFAWSVR